MFWIQIIIPLTLAISGLTILFSDSRNHNVYIQNLYAHIRKHLVEIGERQVDKTRIKERLEEIGKAKENNFFMVISVFYEITSLKQESQQILGFT